MALLVEVHILNVEISIAKMLFWFSDTLNDVRITQNNLIHVYSKILLEIHSLKIYDSDHKYQTFCKSPMEHIFKYDPFNALQKSSWQSVN